MKKKNQEQWKKEAIDTFKLNWLLTPVLRMKHVWNRNKSKVNDETSVFITITISIPWLSNNNRYCRSAIPLENILKD